MADPQGQSSDSVMNPFGLPPEEPGYSYGTLWPVRHKIDANGNQTGPLEWGYLPEALRGAVNDMGIALTAPGNALQGKIPQGQMPDVAQHAAMGMVGMGLPLGMGAPARSVGMFEGKLALTADRAALEEAENLEGPAEKQLEGPQIVKFRGKAFKIEPVKDDPFGGFVVARKLPSGEVIVGKPGHIHADLLGNLDDLKGFLTNDIDDQMGFADKEGNFYSRSEAKAELAKRKQESE